MDLETWAKVVPELPKLLQGLLVNVEILLGLISLGFVVGVGAALLEVYAPRPVGFLASAYTWFFRGVPEIVLLFLFYFGFDQFGIKISAFLAAVLALGFRSSAYQAQIFRGALLSIPAGQVMAARALGLSRLGAIRYVVLPQALRLSLAGWSNEFSSVLKDTTLAWGIGVVEVTRQASYIRATDFTLTLPLYLTVALLFLVLTYAGNFAIGMAEKRLRVPGLEGRR
ncbi:MAG: amino acid ABC transporter permease [Candidatus Bipolaricaulota bacterium]|nr:amino acid ABC transporter permease [Candidatus Bipolaricaulota bacterium]